MKRHTRAFWVGLMAEVRAGAAPADVAKRHRVKESTFRWWRTELRSHTADSAPRLVPVVAAPAVVSASRYVELAIADVVLRVQVGSDVAYVAELARALARPC